MTTPDRPDRVRLRFPIWFFSAALLVVAGCNGDTGDGGKRPLAGETVTVAIPKGLGFTDSWKPILDEWREETGAGYRLVEYQGELPQTAALASGDVTSGDIPSEDLIVFPFVRLGEIAWADRLAPIPQERFGGESRATWLDIYAGLRAGALSVGGRPTLLPFSCPVLRCYLRRDLLEKAGLKPPATWDDYQALVDSVGKWAPGLSVVEPWGNEFRATMFLARALPYVQHPASYSVFFDIETGEPLIDSPGFARALTQALAAVSKMPPETKRYSPVDCRRLMFEGKAAMAVAFETGQPDARPIRRPEGMSVTFVRLPGTTRVYSRKSKSWEVPRDREVNYATLAPFSGLAAGVSKGLSPKRTSAAWSIIKLLSVDRFEQAMANVPRSACRESQLSASPTWVSPDLNSAELFRYMDATADSLKEARVVAELAVVGRERFRFALMQSVTAALEGTSTPEQALKIVAERWRAIAGQLGVDRVRDSYRICLGLSPALKLPAPTKSESTN